MRYRLLSPILGTLLFSAVACASQTVIFSNQCSGSKPERYAMVIANSSYESHQGDSIALDPLPLVLNDGHDVVAALCALGFAVDYGENLSSKALLSSADVFQNAASTHSVRLFYFSGHGFQKAGENYLLPVDARLHSISDIDHFSLNLGAIYQALAAPASQPTTNLILLDACRQNRFSDSSRIPPGLAIPADAPPGTVVAFATAPGTQALSKLDQGDLKHSPYTGAVLKFIRQPGLSVPEMFDSVRQSVLDSTYRHQVPWENSSALELFYIAEPVHVNWRVDAVDDLILIKIRGFPVLESPFPSDHWILSPFELLKPGTNPFEILIYNDKTYRSHNPLLPKEGWRYTVRLRLDEQPERIFACGEDPPSDNHWGTMFVVQSGTINVDPSSGAVNLSISPCGAAATRVPQVARDWRADIDWSSRDTGPPGCPTEYVGLATACLLNGNRKCLIQKAVAAAKDRHCALATRLAVVSQCHNPEASQGIAEAGESAVCGYLQNLPTAGTGGN